jgi:D-glycero-D-manno-heptose 1,7-bisphosphate phosphatase
MKRRRFVVLDRDGTLIVERNYLSDPKGVELLPGVVAGLRKMRELDLGLIVVTNQSGIGRGFFDLNALKAIHTEMNAQLAAGGVVLDGIYFCPHTPEDRCRCRKPQPGLLEQAAVELGLEPSETIVIGDKLSDIDLGRAVRASTMLVRTGYGAQLAEAGATNADYIVADMEEAAGVIGRLLGK